jgi:hypothetical protein
MSYTVGAENVDIGQRLEISGQTQGVSFVGQNTLPPAVNAGSDLNALLDAGMETTGTFTTAASAVTMMVATPSGVSEATFLTGPGRIDARMAAEGATYAIRQTELQADLRTDQVPLPLTFAIAEGALNLTLPLRQSDVPQDFALGLDMQGFAPSETLWGIFDPSAQLPRDPMSVTLDLDGTARLLFDMLDPAPAVATGPLVAPAEIETVDINQIRIAAVGAELTGRGGFTFDNNGDVPMPKGAIDMILKGGNGLIDALIASGILPEQQAIGLRMMMGLLARPVEGADTMTSRIEVNAEGHVLANGQRIR